MTIYLGADHRGFPTKEKIKKWMVSKGWDIEDMGALSIFPTDDYPDFAKKVSKKIISQKGLGILFCGSGVGVDIVANKRKGVRCGLGFSQKQIHSAKADDDINCLAIPSDYITLGDCKKIIEVFITTVYKNEEKYQRRVNKIE